MYIRDSLAKVKHNVLETLLSKKMYTLSKSDCNTVCLLHVCTLYTCTLYSNLCFQTCEYIAVPLSLLTTNMQDLRITWRGADDCNTLSSACMYNSNLCSQRCRIKGSLGSKDHMKRWSLPEELPPTTASLQKEWWFNNFLVLLVFSKMRAPKMIKTLWDG